jgi:hypothetical protein
MALNTIFIESVQLLSNAAATGNAVTAKGGAYIWEVEGTFTGATAQLQVQSRRGTWINVTGAALTANGFLSVDLAADAVCRVSISGGPPSAMFSSLTSVP